ncbi:MAG: hypothetical protein IKL10_01795 [Clostridia bacterium]|nr:hypothetical protein [Clostridia bacterium]
MAGIFLKIVNMSISACWIVLAILLLRIVLKKAPKWINCVLWGLAGLRLVMPFSFESIFSLIPSAETITKIPDSPRPHIDSGVPVIDNQVNGYLQGNYFEGVSRPMGNFVDVTTILAIAWLVGIAALLIYTLISFLRLKSKIGTAVLFRNNIYQSEAVVSPFVLGVIEPKIYLPFNMKVQDMDHVIAHEQAHIRRKDHLWKPLGFLILTLHWFNPMVWLSYVLLCRDIELACDEKVVKELNNEQRADYSEALLTCSVNRKMIAACPLAFGEVGVKDRVKSVLNYKKPAFWIITVAVVVSIATAVCFLTDPMKKSEIRSGIYSLSKELYSDGSSDYIENRRIEIKTAGGMHVYHFIGEMLSTGARYEEVKLNKEIFSSLFGEKTDLSENENLKALLKNNNKAWHDKIPDNTAAYPYMLLSQKDGSLYMVFADFENGEPTRIRYIRELDFAGNVDEKMFYWTYNPILSFTGHSFYPFEFDLDYTHVIASCENGYMQNLEADGQPKDKSLQFTKGQHVYWTPDEAIIEKLHQKSEVIFKVYDGKTELYQCSAVFECISSDIGSANFEISLTVDAELTVIFDDCIKFVSKNSISHTGGAEDATNIIINNEFIDMEQLKAKFPNYFGLSTAKGLEIYIWQMAKETYSCGLLPGTNRNYTQEEIWNLHTSSATLDEMRAIVANYMANGEVTKSDITIQAIVIPHSSYAYNIDDTYMKNLSELFWSEIPIMENTKYVPIIDTATFDIDGDGKDEQCTLSYGPTYGLFTFVISVSENGTSEYCNTYTGTHGNLSFEKTDTGMILRNIPYADSEPIDYSFSIKDGHIVLTAADETVSYWGEEQGIHSITPTQETTSDLSDLIFENFNE